MDGPLFYSGKLFVLKIYIMQDAEGLCERYGVELSDEVEASYLEMKADGRLQSYVDYLSEGVDPSKLSAELHEFFDPYLQRDPVTRFEIARILFEEGGYDDDVISTCRNALLIHPEQNTPPYLLALVTYSLFTARDKEFAVHLYFQQYAADCGLVPSLIAFWKVDTKS